MIATVGGTPCTEVTSTCSAGIVVPAPPVSLQGGIVALPIESPATGAASTAAPRYLCPSYLTSIAQLAEDTPPPLTSVGAPPLVPALLPPQAPRASGKTSRARARK